MPSYSKNEVVLVRYPRSESDLRRACVSCPFAVLIETETYGRRLAMGLDVSRNDFWK